MFAELWDYFWYDLWYDIVDEIPRAELLPSFRELCVGIWSLFCAALFIWLFLNVGSFFQLWFGERSSTPVSPANDAPLDTASSSVMSLGRSRPHNTTLQSASINNITSPTNTPQQPVEPIQLPKYVNAPPFKNFSGNDTFVRRDLLVPLSPDQDNITEPNDTKIVGSGGKVVGFPGGWKRAFSGSEAAVEIQDEGIIELSEHPTNWWALALADEDQRKNK